MDKDTLHKLLIDRELKVDDSLEVDAEVSSCGNPKLIRQCDICGKPFVKHSPRSKYCKRNHYLKCPICGKFYKIQCDGITQTCSKACGDQLMVQHYKENCLAKYGVTNIMYVPEQVDNMIRHRNPNFDLDSKCKTQIRTCVICNRQFEVPYNNNNKCCSPECKSQLRKRTIKLAPRICEICGKTFYSESNTAKICGDTHYRYCPVCGKPIVHNSIVKLDSCCSKQCAIKRMRVKFRSKYGVDYPSQLPEVREKVSTTMKSDEFISKRREASLAKYGVEFPIQAPEFRKQLSDKIKSKEVQDKIRNTTKLRYGYEYSAQSPELNRSRFENRKNIVSSDGSHFDSKYERDFYEYLTSIGITPERQIKIDYEYNGKMHRTFIDFKVGDILFEVKGAPYLEGIYDAKLSVPIEEKLKIYKKHHVIIITDSGEAYKFGHKDSLESNGLKHLDKCPEPLIGVDIDLFRDPKFPYRSDRPECFYDVKVNNCPSQYEAFLDKKIRWDMIINRIQYVGGFIDSKEILVALNVTRKAKQPSWFSRALAERLIKSYCTSDTIVDPFAGWGTRCDAATRLHKTYIGCDSNEQLVKWHNEHGRSIIYEDARNFKYDGVCSVLICPPYSDIEVYAPNQTNLDESSWLDIVIHNIPNAHEYVMVCRQVSDKYKSFIVDTKLNRSHLGSNTEYIIAVPGNR